MLGDAAADTIKRESVGKNVIYSMYLCSSIFICICENLFIYFLIIASGKNLPCDAAADIKEESVAKSNQNFSVERT